MKRRETNRHTKKLAGPRPSRPRKARPKKEYHDIGKMNTEKTTREQRLTRKYLMAKTIRVATLNTK